MVAPDSTSTFSPAVKGAVLPMNWFRNASSSAQRVPKPGVSLAEPISMDSTAPLASKVAVTVTSDWKPCAVAVLPVTGAGAAGFFSATPNASRLPSAGALPSATSLTHLSALLEASSTAVEVTVAPERHSIMPPSATTRPSN